MVTGAVDLAAPDRVKLIVTVFEMMLEGRAEKEREEADGGLNIDEMDEISLLREILRETQRGNALLQEVVAKRPKFSSCAGESALFCTKKWCLTIQFADFLAPSVKFLLFCANSLSLHKT